MSTVGPEFGRNYFVSVKLPQNFAEFRVIPSEIHEIGIPSEYLSKIILLVFWIFSLFEFVCPSIPLPCRSLPWTSCPEIAIVPTIIRTGRVASSQRSYTKSCGHEGVLTSSEIGTWMTESRDEHSRLTSGQNMGQFAGLSYPAMVRPTVGSIHLQTNQNTYPDTILSTIFLHTFSLRYVL